jgi:hypothetical protein
LAAHPFSTLSSPSKSFQAAPRAREEKKMTIIPFSRTTVDDADFTSLYDPVLCEIISFCFLFRPRGIVEGEAERNKNETNGVKIVQAILSTHIDSGKNN